LTLLSQLVKINGLTMTDQIKYTVKNHVAAVTLTKNVITVELAAELRNICAEINHDDQIYVVLISGTGKKFCKGNELENRKIVEASLFKDFKSTFGVADAIAGIDKPVIAAINGDALGQGLELALACDIRIAVQNARFGLTQVKSGLMPMDGGTQRLPRLLGRGKTIEMLLTGKIIESDVALAIGLVSQVVPPDRLKPEAEELAQSMAAKAPVALEYAKEAMNKGMDLTLDQGLRLEADLYFFLHTTSDRTEGIRAFQEKRKPKFEGK
jgi:enoyl-CoA hydratase/carnithine racemase